MYIGKLESNVIVVWENNDVENDIKKDNLKFLSKNKISLSVMKEIFDYVPLGWIEAKSGYLINGSIEANKLYKRLYETVDFQNCAFKLVRFPNAADPYIRLCAKGSCKKNYKNTVIIPMELVGKFRKAAKKYKWTELRYSANPEKYNAWSKYIDENENN